MKIITTDHYTHYVYEDGVEVYDELPKGAYKITIIPMRGPALIKVEMPENKERIYGTHQEKMVKVLRSYMNTDRNLGVILTGEKGLGKTLASRILCNMFPGPVIFVHEPFPGLSDFISSIKGDCMIMFDEFDKQFTSRRHDDDDDDSTDPQKELLSLFDGLDNGHKLFVITCNDLRKLNDYLLNRPGRFHYNIRFTHPSSHDISEYLRINIKPEYYDQVTEIIAFSQRIPLNYDCLRAIAFEVNQGIPFKEAIRDLNIVKVDNAPYTIEAYTADGDIYDSWHDIDPYEDRVINVHLHDDLRDYVCTISFNTKDIIYTNTGMSVPVDKVKVRWNDSDESKAKDKRLVKIIIKTDLSRNYNFVL